MHFMITKRDFILRCSYFYEKYKFIVNRSQRYNFIKQRYQNVINNNIFKWIAGPYMNLGREPANLHLRYIIYII